MTIAMVRESHSFGGASRAPLPGSAGRRRSLPAHRQLYTRAERLGSEPAGTEPVASHRGETGDKTKVVGLTRELIWINESEYGLFASCRVVGEWRVWRNAALSKNVPRLRPRAASFSFTAKAAVSRLLPMCSRASSLRQSGRWNGSTAIMPPLFSSGPARVMLPVAARQPRSARRPWRVLRR